MTASFIKGNWFKRLLFSSLLASFFTSFAYGALPVLPLETVDSVDVCIGQNDAPLTVIEYSSLNCPHCAVFHKTVFPVLKKKYIDTGQIRFIFRHFPIDHKAFVAALVTSCIPSEKRASFINEVFHDQEKYCGKNADVALCQLASIKKTEFETCISNPELQNKILKHRLAAEQIHKVKGAPTFFIEGRQYAGALSLEDLEKDLAKKNNLFKKSH